MAAAPQTTNPVLAPDQSSSSATNHCEACREMIIVDSCRCIGLQLNSRRNQVMDPKWARRLINQLFESPQKQFRQILDDTASSIRSIYSDSRSWLRPRLNSYSSSSSLDRDVDFMYAMRCSPREVLITRPQKSCPKKRSTKSVLSRIVSAIRSFSCSWKGHRQLSEFDSTNSDVSDSDLESRTSWVPALRTVSGQFGEGPLETWHPVLGSSFKDPWTIKFTRHWEPTLPAIHESEMEGGGRLPVTAHTMVVGWLQPRYYSTADAPFKKVPFHNNLHLLRFP